ncbi:MAG: hypothetical protein KDA86_07020 [Planctomycetaceae bacterium]|nr:hypothetical protein [Planctomycetaceae bacterium]
MHAAIARYWGRTELRVLASLVAMMLPSVCLAESFSLEEPVTDGRVRDVRMQVTIGGKVITSAGGGKTASHDLKAAAAYRFREKRLSGSGRDAAAYRSIREFEQAQTRTKISDEESLMSLPSGLRVIVAQGERSGLLRYNPTDLLTRDYLDLIDVPGDPLAVLALLPSRQMEVGEEWDIEDWAAQMLSTVDATSKTEMTAKLADVSDGIARVEFNGTVEGARLGALTNVKLSGHLLFDLKQQLVKTIDLTHAETGAIGTITPGIDSEVRVVTTRSFASSDGALTAELAESIPLDPPADRLPLEFHAEPWGLSTVHTRGWHVFHANFETDPKVVILRLMDQGTLVCQCNFSPVPQVAAGQTTPVEEYEASIRQSLGSQFGAIVARDRIPTDDGRTIFRVTVEGKFVLPKGDETQDVPMTWMYYLCAAPDGRQVSFVFAVEPEMRERLAGQDRQIVETLQFTNPVRQQASQRGVN